MSILQSSNRAEYALLQKLAATLHIPKKDFEKSIHYHEDETATPVYHYDVLHDNYGINAVFYSVSCNNINLAQLLDPKKWAKSPIREAFIYGDSFVSPSSCGLASSCNLCLSVWVKGTVWTVIRRGNKEYDIPTPWAGFLIEDGYSWLVQTVPNFLRLHGVSLDYDTD